MADKKTAKPIFGITTSSPKLTKAGYAAIALYVIIPFLGALLALDVFGYLIAKYAFSSCYGVLCLF